MVSESLIEHNEGAGPVSTPDTNWMLNQCLLDGSMEVLQTLL